MRDGASGNLPLVDPSGPSADLARRLLGSTAHASGEFARRFGVI
jgi:hypothetical protein